MIACSDSGQEVKDLNEVVLDLHDSSMVKMDAIYDQMARLRKAKESLAADSLNPSTELQAEIMQALGQLQAADDGMMDWMNDYKAPDKEAPAEESLKYLKEQKKSIEEVDLNIDNSLKNGENVLIKVEKP